MKYKRYINMIYVDTLILEVAIKEFILSHTLTDKECSYKRLRHGVDFFYKEDKTLALFLLTYDVHTT